MKKQTEEAVLIALMALADESYVGGAATKHSTHAGRLYNVWCGALLKTDPALYQRHMSACERARTDQTLRQAALG